MDQTPKSSSETTDLILIGEHPVLRILPKESDGTFRVTTQISSHNNASIEEPNDSTSLAKGKRIDAKELQNSNMGKTNNDDDSLGWTLVTRRKRKNKDQINRHWNTKESPLNLHAKRLKQQQKCFKCLLKGHVQAVCANPRRCLYCNLPGHIIQNCPEKSRGRAKDTNPPYKSNPIPTAAKHNTSHQKPDISNKKKAMEPFPVDPYYAPRDWQTMPMNCPAAIWHRRPTSMNVYLAPREGLAPSNRFLECSAFIFAGPGRSDPSIKRRIANCMAREFHRDPRDFPVFTICEDFGDALLMFPNADMAAAAINRANFYIGNDITINLHPYSPELQMAFDPLGKRARIRIYGLPLQHWNRAEMQTLVAGFGYPLRFAPYFTNGNYEYLTMLVATRDAGQVPFNLDLVVNPHQKDVRVELDGWLNNDFPPPPTQGGGHRDGRRRNFRRSADEGPSNQARRSPTGRDNRGIGDVRMHRDARDNSSAGSNWTRPINNWIDQLREQLIEAGILNLDISGECRFVGANKQITNDTTELEANGDKIGRASGNARVMQISGDQEFIGTVLEKEGVFIIKQTINGQMNEGLMGGNSNVRIEEILDNETGLDNEVDNGPRNELQMGQEGIGLNNLISDKEAIPPVLNKIQGNNVEVTDDSPPGFPLPIYKKADDLGFGDKEARNKRILAKIKETPPCLTVRRSQRLEKKYSQGRVKYGNSKAKGGKKKGKAILVNEDYQATLDPLNVEQAEMVIKLAGIQVKGSIEEEVAKVVMG